MAYEVQTTSPKSSDFTPLVEHQSATPGSFFVGKPILHLHCPATQIKISQADLNAQPDFASLGAAAADDSSDDATLHGIDVWVTSRYLTLFSPTNSHGLQIPYPTITIHAQQGPAVLLELNLTPDPANTADDDLTFIQLRIIPDQISPLTNDSNNHVALPDDSEVSHPNGPNSTLNGTSTSTSAIPAVTSLYDSISACQELNPDPDPSDADENEDAANGFDETAPGATGWITSENMGDFVDEDGNFRFPSGGGGGAGFTIIDSDENGREESLGAGAGRTRTVGERDGGEGEEDGEGKWQRTG